MLMKYLRQVTSLSPCRFRVEHWFQFPSELESCSPGIDDDNKERRFSAVLVVPICISYYVK